MTRHRARFAFPLVTLATAGAIAAGCSSSAGPAEPEATSTSSSQLQSSEAVYFPPTNYVVQIDELDVLEEHGIDGDGHAADNYVDWAGVAAYVEHQNPQLDIPPQLVGCTLGAAGKVVAGAKFATCTDQGTNHSLTGKLLSQSFTITDQGDKVHVAIALENISDVDPGHVGDAAVSSGLGLLGNGLQAEGAMAPVLFGGAEGSTIAAAGALASAGMGAFGAVAALVGVLFTPSQTNVTFCKGGLMGLESPAGTAAPYPQFMCNGGTPCIIPNAPFDTRSFELTATQLEELTALGPTTVTLGADVHWPQPLLYDWAGACNSAHTIRVSVHRDINSGLAPSPKSTDMAVARASDRLDVFRPNAALREVEDYGWNELGWQSQPLTSTYAYTSLPPATHFAAISRGPKHVDVFWADPFGNLDTAAWSDDAPSWVQQQIINSLSATGSVFPGMVPPNAKLAVVATTPGTLDVFFVDKNATIERASWSGWGWSVQPIPRPSNVAAPLPGASLAAVARTWENIDVFYVGTDGALWDAYTSPSPGVEHAPPANARFLFQAISPTSIAPAGAPLTAVARDSDHVDVFAVTASGSIAWSAWRWTVPASGWTALTVPGSASACAPGGAVSAVATNPNSLDVVCAKGTTIEELSWNPTIPPFGATIVPSAADSSWKTTALASPAPIDTSNLSIVARTVNNLDVFFADTSGQLRTAYRAPGTAAWTVAGPLGAASTAPLLVGPKTAAITHFSGSNPLDTVYVGNDGAIYDDRVFGLGSWNRTAIGSAPVGATLATDANAGAVNVLFADADGALRNILGMSTLTFANGMATWKTTWSAPEPVTPPGLMPPGGGVAMAEQAGTQLDAFFVDDLGKLQVAWGPLLGNAWDDLQAISGPSYAPPGAHLATGVQAGTQLDVFAIDNNGNLGGYHVTGMGAWAGAWSPSTSSPPFVLAGGFPPGAPITTLSFGNQLFVLAVNNSGELWSYSVSGLGAWTGHKITAGAIRGAVVAAGIQNGNQIDVLYVDQWGTLEVAWLYSGTWYGPGSVASGGARFAPGAPVTAGFQGGSQLDAFVPATDGTMRVTWAGSSGWASPAVLP